MPGGRLPMVLPMAEAPAPTLIEELDARQDEVLAELDALNQRIEATLKETLAWRQQWSGEAEELPKAA